AKGVKVVNGSNLKTVGAGAALMLAVVMSAAGFLGSAEASLFSGRASTSAARFVITINRSYAILGPYRAVDGSDDADALEQAFGPVSACLGSRGTWKQANLRAYFNFAGDGQSCPPLGQLDLVIVGEGWRTS